MTVPAPVTEHLETVLRQLRIDRIRVVKAKLYASPLTIDRLRREAHDLGREFEQYSMEPRLPVLGATAVEPVPCLTGVPDDQMLLAVKDDMGRHHVRIIAIPELG